MEHSRIRAVVTTTFGCKERTEWFRGITPQAIDAVNALVHRQKKEEFTLNWEEWEDGHLLKPWRSRMPDEDRLA